MDACALVRTVKVTLAGGALLLLTACATYQPKPLATRPDLARRIPPVTLNAKTFPIPALARHPFNPANGMDMTEVATLAVVNNPELKIARAGAGVAHAQLFAAGLLPDPQLSLSSDQPISGPATTSAYNFGLNYDVASLITRTARVGAARQQLHEVNLGLLWQEWQVVQQARMLFIQRWQQKQMLRVLERYQTLFAKRYRQARRALKQGDVTLGVAGADLTALLDANTRINTLRRQMIQTRHALNALLGLAPNVRLHLAGGPKVATLGRRQINRALAHLSQRPDLLALKAGYESQEQRLREAVLAQFPALNVGITRARDTGGVNTAGVGVTLTLPFLNGNRGNIAIQRATRAQIYTVYQARLDQAYGQVDQLLAEQALLKKQYRRVQASLPALEAMARKARYAFSAGNLDVLSYVTLETSLLKRRSEAISLRQSLLEVRVALQTLVGSLLPVEKVSASRS